MSERLKQIWSAYEAKTSRRLTGRGVENIVAPSRASTAPQPAFPADYVAPAEAAFTALKRELAAKERRQAGGRRAADPGAQHAADGARFGARLNLAPDEPVAAMLRGLASTERRTDRPPLDYSAFASANADRKLKSLKKRRKFLGLF
ncbi:MAG: hypothetical protein GC152_01890 [Alphaproteobacteria bacterium]|nr:hypothetical protein [Alphaproteobacteria bacterium]